MNYDHGALDAGTTTVSTFHGKHKSFGLLALFTVPLDSVELKYSFFHQSTVNSCETL